MHVQKIIDTKSITEIKQEITTVFRHVTYMFQMKMNEQLKRVKHEKTLQAKVKIKYENKNVKDSKRIFLRHKKEAKIKKL